MRGAQTGDRRAPLIALGQILRVLFALFGAALLARLDERFVGMRRGLIDVQAPGFDFPDTGCDAIEKIAIVRDDQIAALARGDVRLKPANRPDVQMIGRLVEDEIVGVVDEQVGEGGLGTLSAGKTAQRPRKIVAAKTERRQHDAKRFAAQAEFGMIGARQCRIDEFLQCRFGFVGDALREIAELCVARAHDRSAKRHVDAGKQAKQR